MWFWQRQLTDWQRHLFLFFSCNAVIQCSQKSLHWACVQNPENPILIIWKCFRQSDFLNHTQKSAPRSLSKLLDISPCYPFTWLNPFSLTAPPGNLDLYHSFLPSQPLILLVSGSVLLTTRLMVSPKHSSKFPVILCDLQFEGGRITPPEYYQVSLFRETELQCPCPEPVQQRASTVSTAREARVQWPVTGWWVKPSNRINSQVMTAHRCCWDSGLLECPLTVYQVLSHISLLISTTLWEVGTFWHAHFVSEKLQLRVVKWFIKSYRGSRSCRGAWMLVCLWSTSSFHKQHSKCQQPWIIPKHLGKTLSTSSTRKDHWELETLTEWWTKTSAFLTSLPLTQSPWEAMHCPRVDRSLSETPHWREPSAWPRSEGVGKTSQAQKHPFPQNILEMRQSIPKWL